jgi:hypothetical protein
MVGLPNMSTKIGDTGQIRHNLAIFASPMRKLPFSILHELWPPAGETSTRILKDQFFLYHIFSVPYRLVTLCGVGHRLVDQRRRRRSSEPHRACMAHRAGVDRQVIGKGDGGAKTVTAPNRNAEPPSITTFAQPNRSSSGIAQQSESDSTPFARHDSGRADRGFSVGQQTPFERASFPRQILFSTGPAVPASFIELPARCFCCFCRRLSASHIASPAGILGFREVRRKKKRLVVRRLAADRRKCYSKLHRELLYCKIATLAYDLSFVKNQPSGVLLTARFAVRTAPRPWDALSRRSTALSANSADC